MTRKTNPVHTNITRANWPDAKSPATGRRRPGFRALALLGSTCVGLASCWLVLNLHPGSAPRPSNYPSQAVPITHLPQLLATPPDQISQYDIALLNLCCAEALPG